ncbi:MAG: hypothetical protein WC956_01530 [bacterium]
MKILPHIIKDKQRRDEELRRQEEGRRIPQEAPEPSPSSRGRRIEAPTDGNGKSRIVVIEL